ncbi:MAG TPA: hypothetical protein VGE52_12015, partial [Pirellulales bacterium]
MYEEHRYGEAIKSANVAGYSHYLNEFPNGRHAEEIVVLLDDANFAEAQRASTDAHSPAGLRAYLSDSRNKRHVAEAQKQINVYYEEAIARLKSAAEGKNVDQELFQGLLGLLEWVKTQPAPVVPVAFAAEQEAETKNDEVRSEIELAKSFYKEKNPELNSIPNDGVIGQGDVFGDEPTRTREEVILQRVRASVQNVLGADVVTFERAKEGEQAMLDVHYHIEPSGNVYLYTTTNEADPALIVGRKVNGLLLGYGVGWRITLRGAAGAEHVFVVGSQPASSLNYSSDSSDPEWAPYAVLLLSAFYDMSNQMVSNFAIEPPPAPTHFTFRDATTDVSGAALPNPFMPEMPDLPTLPDDVTGRPFDPTAPLTPGKMPPLFDPNNPTSPDLPPLPDLPSLPGVPSPPEIPSPPGSPGAPGPLGESPSDGAGPQDRSDPTTNPSVAPTEIEASPPSTGAP